jgi:transposase
VERPEITVGVDSHKDFNVAVALDGQGRVVGTTTAPTTQVGYSSLFAWAKSYGLLAAVGIEGTGSYGAGLCRHLRAKGVRVLEVERPERKGGEVRGRLIRWTPNELLTQFSPVRPVFFRREGMAPSNASVSSGAADAEQ